MTKIRKQKRKKKYRYGINRKRMNKKKLPKPQSKLIQDAWKDKMTCQQNMKAMGLLYDVNKEIKTIEECNTAVDTNIKPKPNTTVAEDLEKEAKEMHGPNRYRLPKNQVEYLIYLLDKYGEDYKAMAKDKKNVIQATWKQLRAKVNRFKKIPEQFNEYLRNKETANVI